MRPGYLSVRPPVGPSVLSAQQPQGYLVPPIFATPVVRLGAWNDDLGLRRYAEPPMVNPIEPGVAADPERPGTGVDLNPMKPASYDQRWDQKLYDQLRQDVLITAEGGHVPTGHGSGWALYGRRIVVRGIERTAAASPGISKITFYPSPLNGRVHVEGMVFDQTLGGSDDMFMIQQGPYLWDTNVTDWNNYLPGSLIITPSLRLYVILARGVGPSAEPVDETGNSFTSGTATIAFVKKFADKAAFEAEFPRQDHTFQRIYAKGRHGCYYSYYAGASNTTGEEYVKASVPVTKVVRDATGLVTLTTAAAHNVVAGTHPLINVCHVPYEAVNGEAKRTVGGLWVPTIVDATTITYQTTVTGTPMTWTAPAAEPYYLQPFTRLGSGSATVAGKTITITTNAPHLLPALGTAGLQWVCVWGAAATGLPVLMEGDLLVVSAASGSTITATIPNAYSLPDGTYPNLAVLGHGLFPSSAGRIFGAHADFAQVEVSSRVGAIRAYQVTDTHFSYDAYLFGTRFPLETMVKGAEMARCNWRRRQEHIPYDPGNATFIANEADEANFGVPLYKVILAQQGPRGLTDVAFGRECTVELDRNETGNNVCNPSPGRHINGLDAGALFRSEFGQRYVYYPPVAHIAGRLYLTPCQEGDTRPRDVLQRSQVGTGYVRGALADAPTLVAPPAPTFKLLAAAFSENTLADVDLGWVDVVPDPSALLDLGRGLFAWRGNSHGLRDSIVDVTIADTKGGRVAMSGARIKRGRARLDYASAVDIGGGQRGFMFPLVAKNRNDRTLQATGQLVIPVTAEASPLPSSAVTLDPAANNASNTLSEGFLRVTTAASTNTSRITKATAAVAAGRKVYFELRVLGVYVGTGRAQAGLTAAGTALNATPATTAGTVVIQYNGTVSINGSTSWTRNGASATIPAGPSWLATGSVLRFAYDVDAKRLWIGLNDAWASGQGDTGAGLAAGQMTGGNPATGLGGWDLSDIGTGLLPSVALRGQGDDFRFAFDGGGWAYPPPAGFTAL